MCKKKAKPSPPNKLSAPLFWFGVFKDFAIISMGGGGKDYGNPNQVKVFKKELPMMNELYTQDLETELMSHFSFSSLGNNYMVAAISKYVVILSIDDKTGALSEITRYEADFAPDLPSVSKVKWSADDKILISGGEDGVMRIFNVKYNNNDITGLEQQIELGKHLRDINDVSLNSTNELAVSSSTDKTWRIYTVRDGKCIKRLSFSEDIGGENLQFKGVLFSKDDKYLFTLATKIKGRSYLIKWDATSDNFDPVDTMVAHKNPSWALTMDNSGNYMAIGTNDGHIIAVNPRQMSSYRCQKKHKLPVESIKFNNTGDLILTASLDYTYEWTQNASQTSWSMLLVKIWFILLIFALVYVGLKNYIQ